MQIKQLSSFVIFWIDGGVRLSYTYDIIDSETGQIVKANQKDGFYVVDPTLLTSVESIRDYIRNNKF